jgi:hypothetical protein
MIAPQHTHTAVFAFRCGFVTVPSQDQDFGIVRYRWRSRTPRQRNLDTSIAHEVLSHLAMLGYGSLSTCACPCHAALGTKPSKKVLIAIVSDIFLFTPSPPDVQKIFGTMPF